MLLLYFEDLHLAMEEYGQLTGMALPFLQFPATITNSLALILLPIVSKEASALIQQLLIAMQNKISITQLKEVCFAHPTFSEGIFEAIHRI